MKRKRLHATVTGVIGLALPFYAMAQSAPPSAGDSQAQADVQTLTRELQTLKASYAQEVRRLRELDIQVQAMQARLSGKASSAMLPDQTAMSTTALPKSPAGSVDEEVAGSQSSAQQSQETPATRSLNDALQQNTSVFNRKLTMENGLTYSWYDRNQLTLNGFLALDAIFLGNIALQDVKSRTLTYDFTTRYSVTPRLTLNIDVPYLGRQTSYFQGGAGGAASATQEETTSGYGIGDVNLSANYKLFTEEGARPDTVLTLGVTAPTGKAPYGINWDTPGGNSNNTDGKFAVPVSQPTGNGLWQASLNISAVKTMDPAIVFANIGYGHAFARKFPDIDTDPQTTTPGSVALGNSYYLGAGVAFAFNDRTSLSLSFSDKISDAASIRQSGGPWTKVIGSDANAATFSLGVTYALSQHTTLVTSLGVGLTPDAPNYTLNFKVPYLF